MRGPTQNLGPIGSAVFTVIGYKTNKQTQAKYMYKKNVFLSGLCVSLGNNSLKVFSSHSTGYWKHDTARIQDTAGYRIQDTGYITQDTGYRVHDTGYRIHDTGYRIQDTGYRIQDTGYRIQDTRYRIQNTGYRIQDTGYKTQVTGYRIGSKK